MKQFKDHLDAQLETRSDAAMAEAQQTQPTTDLSVDAVRLQINKFLAAHLGTRCRKAAAISPDYERLWQTIATTAMDGKRLRPYLTYLAYDICGGNDTQLAMRIGTSLELLHLCMLAHDDIIDRDFVRHSKPNIAGQYRQTYGKLLADQSEIDHFASGAALLAGDLLLSDTYQYFVRNSARLDPDMRQRLMELLDLAIFTVAGGELIDSEAPMYPVGQSDSLMVATYKTAYYSCSVPLAFGAVLAGADADTERQYFEAGTKLGVAYQLTDDLLGVFGDEAKTGKSTMSDLREAKRTYLLQKTYELVDDQQRANIDRILAHDRHDDTKLAAIKQIMVDSGAQAATASLRDKYVSQALEVTSKLQLANPKAHRLDSFIYSLAGRVG